MSKKKIKKILENDLLRLEDIHACLVTGKNTGTITPDHGVEINDVSLWKLIQDSTSEFFKIAREFAAFGLNRIFFELGNYDIIMNFINAETALITVIPALSNRGLIEVEIENAKGKIEKRLE